MALVDLSDIHIDITDIRMDEDEAEELIREHFEKIDFSVAIDVVMDYCSPVKFTLGMLALMSKDQVKQVISKFTETEGTEKELLIRYIRQINPDWNWEVRKHGVYLNIDIIDAVLRALIGQSNTIKPADLK
jgi:hypothetical protein